MTKSKKEPELDMGLAMEGHAQRALAAAEIRRAKWREIAKDYLTPEQIFAQSETINHLGNKIPGKFNICSLAAWLEIVKQAGVPKVPAKTLGKIPQQFFWDVLDDKKDIVVPEAWEKILDQLQDLADNEMIRWDHCANEDVKYAIHDGDTQGWRKSYYTFGDENRARPRTMLFDDMRVVGLLECYEDPIIIHKRPWIEAKRVPGIGEFADKTYPAEWRIFIKDGQIEGYSWYYPQSACLDTDLILAQIIDKLSYYTTAIILKLHNLHLEPHHPYLDDAPEGWRPCFTLDFLQTPDNNLLFLEAGPPHCPGWGASACCFIPGNIKGVALKKQYQNVYNPSEGKSI
jgi:hypothetical protein